MDRRRLLALILGVAGTSATVGIVGVSMAATTEETPDPSAIEPAYGAGLFDVDPDQAGVSQDPTISVMSDLAALPEDMEF